MIRTALACCLTACALVMATAGVATAAPATTGTTTFAVAVVPVNVADGYDVHVTGVGLTGPWRGWHLAADIVTSTDCSTDCMVEKFGWELYDHSAPSSAEWGGCPDPFTCAGATIGVFSGDTNLPVTVSGGYPYSAGDGSLTGSLPPGAPDEPAAGYLTLSLSLH